MKKSTCPAVYCLEKQICRDAEDSPQTTWKRYATCGRRALLERVRMGQTHPEHWRVTRSNTDGGKHSVLTLMKKAG